MSFFISLWWTGGFVLFSWFHRYPLRWLCLLLVVSLLISRVISVVLVSHDTFSDGTLSSHLFNCYSLWWLHVVSAFPLPLTEMGLCNHMCLIPLIRWCSIISNVQHLLNDMDLYNFRCFTANSWWIFVISGVPLSYPGVALLYLRNLNASYWGSSALPQVHYFVSLTCFPRCPGVSLLLTEVALCHFRACTVTH